MSLLGSDFYIILTYSLLFITVVSLWLPRWKGIPVWYAPFLLAIGFGLISGRLTAITLLPMGLFYGAVLALRKSTLPPVLRCLAVLAILLLGFGLGAHLFPGFNNLTLVDKGHSSAKGIPFQLYLNFDKTVIGILILGELHELITRQKDWSSLLKTLWPGIPVLIVGIACVALILGFVLVDPKLSAILGLWSSTNLLFVSVAEEGFFRGFMQKYLAEMFEGLPHGKTVALLLASLLFGIAHIAGGPFYVALASLGGLLYGWMYQKTQRIEASILTHFLLNQFYFLALTFPSLAVT